MRAAREFVGRHGALLGLAGVAAWAIALYAYVLRLPFFRDDMVMLLWLREMPWGRLWVDATGFPYYRPLSFSTLKLSELAFGWPEPVSLHVLNLALHAANSVMVALLAQRFFEGNGKRIAGFAAGLLFAAYPFTYEIMPTTGQIFQLQAAFFGMGAALAYLNFRCQVSNAKEAGRRLESRWLWVSLAMALLGTFTCEYGVIIPAFVLLVEVMLWRQGRPTVPGAAHTVQAPAEAMLLNRPTIPGSAHTMQAPPEAMLLNRPTMNRRADNAKPAEADYAGFSWVPLVYFVFAVVYLTIWVVVPKSRAEEPLILQGLGPAMRDMPVTALYYLQGLTWPLQTLAWPLVRATGSSQEMAVLVVGVLTLGGIVAVYARARRLPLLAFALAWFAIGIAPMWPTLNADYTLNGPRLHYLPSIGTTMLWGGIVAVLLGGSGRKRETLRFAQGDKVGRETLHFAQGDKVGGETLHFAQGDKVGGGTPRFAQGDRLSKAAGVLVLAAMLAQSLAFLYGMADVITIGGKLTADVSRTIAARPPDETALVVNFPSWIGMRETTYALGAEGISFLPGYSTMREMVRLNTRQDRDVKAVTFTNTIKEWKYDQRLGPPVNWNRLLREVRAAGRVWVVEYLPETLRVSEAGSVEPVVQAEPFEVTFGERVGLRLAGYSLTADELRVELAWTNVLTVDQQLTAFVHVYDAQGKLVAQQDGYPLLGLVPPWLAQTGEVVHDVRHIPLPARLAAGQYTVGVWVYDAESGQRAPAISPRGGRFENDVYLGLECQMSSFKCQVANGG